MYTSMLLLTSVYEMICASACHMPFLFSTGVTMFGKFHIVYSCTLGGGVFTWTLVLWAKAPADVTTAGAIMSLPHPPGELTVPQQFGHI